MTRRHYYVYILASKRNGVLYIGVTNHLARRAHEHKDGTIEGFTKRYHVDRLVYFEAFDYVDQALAREKALKRWKREWKIELIESTNPDWKDLYLELNELV
jgi:putative endonuclease